MAFSCVLHFVTSQFPAILMLEEEMGDVRTAAKVSLQELEKDVKTFKTELKDVEKVNYKFVVYSPPPPPTCFWGFFRIQHLVGFPHKIGRIYRVF